MNSFNGYFFALRCRWGAKVEEKLVLIRIHNNTPSIQIQLSFGMALHCSQGFVVNLLSGGRWC